MRAKTPRVKSITTITAKFINYLSKYVMSIITEYALNIKDRSKQSKPFALIN